MGKKKDRADQSGKDEISPQGKKPKKHKHKKASRKEEVEHIINVEDVEDVDISVDDIDDSPSSALKLKIKLQENTPDKGSTPKPTKSKSEKVKSSGKKNNKKKEGKGNDDTDSEEERWLDAIETGKLEEVDDELKRMKNPKLMTARQRAMLEKRSDGPDETFPIIPAEPLLSLPSGFKEKVVTEEMLAKKAIKTKKRREQAHEKREEDKKKTVDRLLKKQESKIAKISRHRAGARKDIPTFSYIINQDIRTLSVPVGLSYPIEEQNIKPPSEVKLCKNSGCSNHKKYSCSKTGVPLCSLKCYNENLAKHFH
ncbi:INO80 complex subunit B isoform X2 [Oratosquilla oratoria]|uniref:INO80 complex subunit B isoform X2 n=1 Tax=Oratosquilla oratoria TaxID=337810 RepID=UPI003F76F675